MLSLWGWLGRKSGHPGTIGPGQAEQTKPTVGGPTVTDDQPGQIRAVARAWAYIQSMAMALGLALGRAGHRGKSRGIDRVRSRRPPGQKPASATKSAKSTP
jgi:hypothetical protein